MGCAESQPVSSGPSLSLQKKEKANEAKIVLLGDSGVGKSSMALRFCQGRFPPYHEVTIGAAFLQQVVRIRGGEQIKLHLWDTGGQERFRAMAPLYYRDANGAVVVYDCSDPASFENVKFWVSELKSKGPENCQISIVANKSDLEEEKKLVPREQGKEYLDSLQDSSEFFEVSALTGQNIGQLFESMAGRIVNSRRP